MYQGYGKRGKDMKFVYLIMRGEGYGRVIGVFKNEIDATIQVHLNAETVWGIDPDKEPLDFDGALMRYGWADRVWWQKEVLYE
jgi:hypothetical protein